MPQKFIIVFTAESLIKSRIKFINIQKFYYPLCKDVVREIKYSLKISHA